MDTFTDMKPVRFINVKEKVTNSNLQVNIYTFLFFKMV